jgi:hypothetical protein
MNILEKLPEWVRANRYYTVDFTFVPDSKDENFSKDDSPVDAGPMQANVISSICFGDPKSELDDVYHYPLLDLDVKHELVPSSTPGHSHLYIKTRLGDAQYRKLLVALNEAGIIQKGILNQFDRYGATMLRLPHIKKEGLEW